jgi:hypothetical protein
MLISFPVISKAEQYLHWWGLKPPGSRLLVGSKATIFSSPVAREHAYVVVGLADMKGSGSWLLMYRPAGFLEVG